MTQDSRPHTGTTTGDAGPYGSLEWSDMYSRMFNSAYTGANGAANRGVWRGVLNNLKVQATNPASTSVEILTGGAIVSGKEYDNNATVTQAIAANASGSVRIDIITLEADYNTQTVRIKVVQGTPAAGVPALTQSAGTLWQIPLAYITLASGFVSITDSVITDWRHWASIPNAIMKEVTNNSGVILESGTSVIYDTGTDQITRSTNPSVNTIAGVVEARVAIGGTCRIVTNGLYEVICDGSVAVGDLLHIGATAGQASNSATSANSPTIFARVLQANTGAGTKALCFINVPVRRKACRCAVFHNAAQAVAAATPTVLAFNSERWDTDTMHDTVTNNSRITFNTPGLYMVSASIDWSVAPSLTNFIAIRLNGTTFLAISSHTTSTWAAIATSYYFVATDYVEVVVQNNNAANVNSNANYSPEFRAVWISE